MPNRISTILDIDDKGFKGSLKSIGSAVGEADGLFGKFKAGATAGMDVVKANAAAFSVAAGASLVAFGVKAVGAFTETAKAAIDLSTSTGLAVEDASRWIGVGDDYKVGADALATGLGKIAKTLDDEKWTKYGIATRDAGGQARDVNDILLDSFDTLSKMTNKTEQARVGQELFGKGYQSLTPILGHTREEYEKMLGSVEKGQVITSGEAEKAEKFRLAEDQLGDALKEVTLSVGQQVASLAPLLSGLAKLITLVSDAEGKLGGYNHEFIRATDYLSSHSKEVERSGHDYEYWSKQVLTGKLTAEQLETQLKKLDDTTTNSQTSTQGYSYALQDMEQSAKDSTEAVKDSTTTAAGYSYAVQDIARSTEEAKQREDEYKAAAKSMSDDVQRDLDEIKSKWDELSGNIDADKSLLNLQGNFDEVKQKAKDAWEAAGKGADDAEAKIRDAKLASDDLKLAVIDYGKEVLGLPPEKVTKLLAEIDAGNLDAVEALLDALARNRTVSLSIIARKGAGYGGLSGDPEAAQGGIVMPTPGGTRVIVGEGGSPEAIIPLDGKHSFNAGGDTYINGGSQSAQPQGTPSIWSGTLRPVNIQVMMGNRIVEEILISADRLRGSVS